VEADLVTLEAPPSAPRVADPLSTTADQQLADVGRKARGGPRWPGWAQLAGATSVLVGLAVWQVAATYDLVSAKFVSSPSRVATASVDLLRDGTLLEHVQASMQRLGLGFGLALLVGLAIATLVARVKVAQWVLEPYLAFLQAIPTVALIPLIVLVFGIGLKAQVFVVFLITLFPIAITSIDGLRRPDPDLVRCARAFGASEWRVFRCVTAPSALPFVFSAMRLGMGKALVGMVVAEFYSASSGIGYFINRSGSMFQTDHVFVGILTLSVIGGALIGAIDWLEDRVMRWAPDDGQR
jgi:ABC-type nitrate/sulfonate/bicarbonate transport system permease component